MFFALGNSYCVSVVDGLTGLRCIWTRQTAAAAIKGSPDRIPVGDGPTNRLPPSTVNSAAWDIMTLTALCANTAGKMLPVRRHR